MAEKRYAEALSALEKVKGARLMCTSPVPPFCVAHPACNARRKHLPDVRYNRDFMADDKLYKAEYQGSGTFLITKPKRKAHKLRQSRLKAPKRGARK